MTRGGAGRDGGERDRNGRQDPPGSGREGPRSRTAAEWITLAVSAALILAVAGLVTYLTVAGGDRPPVVVATPLTDAIRHEDGRSYLPVEVENRGDQTAQDVVIRAELATAGAVETVEFTIDFLAGGGVAEGTVAFATDPTTGALTVGVASFR